MSTIKVDSIQATDETASRAVSGVAAAWVHFDGTGTVAINNSVNVASITDRGVGMYALNFSNNLGNANYAGSGMSGNDYSTTTGRTLTVDDAPTTSVFAVRNINCRDTATTAIDDSNMLFSIHGDLA